MLSECETSQCLSNSKVLRFFGLCPQNDKPFNVKHLFTYSPINLFTKRRVAFTLAEVLITLGVIGVVAAMTIPTLIKNHEKHVIETQLKKTYSDIGNWIKRSEVDNGSAEYWDYGDSSSVSTFVDTYLAPYISLKKCNVASQGKCFKKHDNGYNLWKLPNGNFTESGADRVYDQKYLLPDGRAIAVFAEHDTNFGRDWTYINFRVDVNGARGESILGKDVFSITYFNYNYGNIKNKGKLLFGGRGSGPGYNHWSDSELITHCKGSGDTCGILLQRNGWKFPKDYPIKF